MHNIRYIPFHNILWKKCFLRYGGSIVESRWLEVDLHQFLLECLSTKIVSLVSWLWQSHPYAQSRRCQGPVKPHLLYSCLSRPRRCAGIERDHSAKKFQGTMCSVMISCCSLDKINQRGNQERRSNQPQGAELSGHASTAAKTAPLLWTRRVPSLTHWWSPGVCHTSSLSTRRTIQALYQNYSCLGRGLRNWICSDYYYPTAASSI